MKKEIKIGEVIKVGWSNFRKRPWYLLGLTLAVAALFVLGSSQNAMVTALAYIVYGGYLFVLIKHFRGEEIVFDDLFSLDSRWISFAFLGLIKGILITLGFVLFIIPGIYLSIRWMFAGLLVIDQNMKPLQALRASSEMTMGNKWKLLGFSIVSLILFILGLLFIGIGAVIAGIVVTFAVIKLYTDLRTI